MQQKGISKLDLKRQNRMQILRVIRENGPISRVDIAAELELTRAAVTIITNEMIAEGVLQELGEAPVEADKLQKGRRKILIGINATNRFALGATISPGYVSVGLSTLDAEVLDKTMMPIGDDTKAEDVLNFIAESCKNMVENSCLAMNKILGLGVGVMPLMWDFMGVKLEDNTLDFKSVIEPLERMLEMQVLAANAVGLIALASQDFSGLDGRRRNIVLLAGGQQYNVAVLNKNLLLPEYEVNTMSIERIVINPNGASAAGYPNGSVKAELTEEVILRKLRAVYSQKDTPYLYEATGGDMNKITEEIANEAYVHGDKPVQEVVNQIVDNLAVLVNNLQATHYANGVVLHNIQMNEFCFAYFKNKLAEIAGQEIADRVEFSRADRRYSFRGGSALAIYQLFYVRGGMNP